MREGRARKHQGCLCCCLNNVNDQLADSSQVCVCVRSIKPQSLYGAILIVVTSGSDFFGIQRIVSYDLQFCLKTDLAQNRVAVQLTVRRKL